MLMEHGAVRFRRSRNSGMLYFYIGISALVLAMLIVFPKWMADDAYIYARYASNLCFNGELVFNVGEKPVEGYTGILLPLITAVGLRMGCSPELAVHFVGVFSFFCLLAFWYMLLKNMCNSSLSRYLTLTIFVTAPFLYTHVFNGMETILFVTLLMAAALQFHFVIVMRSDSFPRHILLFTTLLGLSLCRPEGVAYSAIVVGCFGVRVMLKSGTWRLGFLASVISYVLPLLVYLTWKLTYYGYLLPNTFYAKESVGLSLLSVIDLARFGLEYLLLPVVCTGLLIRFKYRNGPEIWTLGSLVLFCVIIVVQYVRSDLAMNFSHRFYVPLYPVALLVLAWLCTNVSKHKSSISILSQFVISLQILLHCWMMFAKEIPAALKNKTMLTEMHCAAGSYLKDRVPPQEWLVVHIDAGAIPFFSGLKTVDFGGLNDGFLAHNKNASVRERVDYFFSYRPGAVVFTSYEWDRVVHGSEAEDILSDKRFCEYALVKKFGNTTGERYYQFVFLRRDLLRNGEEKYMYRTNDAYTPQVMSSSLFGGGTIIRRSK
jgi:arabinofuranosyltransferase